MSRELLRTLVRSWVPLYFGAELGWDDRNPRTHFYQDLLGQEWVGTLQGSANPVVPPRRRPRSGCGIIQRSANSLRKNLRGRGVGSRSANLLRIEHLWSRPGARAFGRPQVNRCGVEQELARLAHNQEVAGANPAPATPVPTRGAVGQQPGHAASR